MSRMEWLKQVVPYELWMCPTSFQLKTTASHFGRPMSTPKFVSLPYIINIRSHKYADRFLIISWYFLYPIDI